MMTIPFDALLPPVMLHEVSRMIDGFRAKRQSVRVVRLHVDDYMELLRRVSKGQFMPWTPTICGVPVEPWEKAELGVFAVADDNTPLTASGGIVREEL